MPLLKNARHEAFAQAIARGMTATDAYSAAGYKGDRTAASRLSTNVNIKERVAEVTGKVNEHLMEKLTVTKERIVGELAKIGFSNMLD